MNKLLRQYITEVVSEISDPRVPNQLISKRSKKQKDSASDKEKRDNESEVEEHAIVGYTAPLGASSADVGEDPTRPGEKLKKKSKNFVRWK